MVRSFADRTFQPRLGVANVDEAWSFFEKKSGTACSQLSDFQQTAGSFAVTARPDIAVDYVVTPGEDVSIEVTKDTNE